MYFLLEKIFMDGTVTGQKGLTAGIVFTTLIIKSINHLKNA